VSVYALVLLVSLFVYTTLLVAMLRDRGNHVRRVFIVYLGIAVIWSASTFMTIADIVGPTRMWAGIVVLCGFSMMMAYYHFVCAFVGRDAGIVLKLGYSVVALVVVPLVALGYMPQSVSVSNGMVDIYYGPFLYLFSAVAVPFFALSAILLVRKYRATRDALSRRRIGYLLAGLGLLLAFGIRVAFPPTPHYPLEHIGHLANAVFIAYAITRHGLLDLRLVMRKGLAYSSVSVLVTALFLVLLISLQGFIQTWTSAAGIVTVVVMAFGMAWLLNPLILFVQRNVDRLFYRETYEYRALVLSFARRMSNVLDLGELAEAMLKPIVRAVGASQASLLLARNDEFISEYVERLVDGETPTQVKFGKDSPVVTWVDEHDEVLSEHRSEMPPGLREAWDVEQAVSGAGVDLLVPMKSKDKLIGLLALSRKESGGRYSGDDVDLVATLVHEAAVAVENAQLYAQAKERAHIDELTGLYNHRYFHERLDEEISRCSRFGDIFSLLFIDMDLFKTYNDVYGHLEGDEILSRIGRDIVASIRSIDMAFRYGGDEFTVILPQASLEDACVVAERVRKRIESDMDSRGVSLTCSVGVASWPTDGVMREDILQAADAALYSSKEAGRNRVSMASEVTRSRALGLGIRPEGEPGVLSTIYALAATVDAKDHYTYGHSKKVSKYATEIAEALGFSEDRVATIRAAALLHDIGKIGVSDGVLMKPGTLDPDDWDAIRAHPKLGVAILKHVTGLSGCLAAIQYHHERYDGSGYPAGLKGENVPLDARILSVADSYDAMTSLRPYREGKMSQEQAMQELSRCSGTQFDPKIVEVFIAVRQGKATRRSGEPVAPAQKGSAAQ
jgi:diguanylate cyclase (GGDEF)-like protein/putative nucleotidyltransferase with HDIG domain